MISAKSKQQRRNREHPLFLLSPGFGSFFESGGADRNRFAVGRT
jgi:hypothetical protein